MESHRNAEDGDWAYAPAPAEERTYRELGNFTVTGETFAAIGWEPATA